MLQVTFRATAQGYAITRMRQVMGAPTLAINQDRAVLLVAADPNGSVVASVSVPNPRVVHTAGSRDPATAVLDEATFTVNFPDPQAIRSIDVTVREGPNAAYKQRFPVQDYPRPATQ
ncbi:MAG: hypothetical protein ACREQ8_14825 [Woeseiaceae bacterium]